MKKYINCFIVWVLMLLSIDVKAQIIKFTTNYNGSISLEKFINELNAKKTFRDSLIENLEYERPNATFVIKTGKNDSALKFKFLFSNNNNIGKISMDSLVHQLKNETNKAFLDTLETRFSQIQQPSDPSDTLSLAEVDLIIEKYKNKPNDKIKEKLAAVLIGRNEVIVLAYWRYIIGTLLLLIVVAALGAWSWGRKTIISILNNKLFNDNTHKRVSSLDDIEKFWKEDIEKLKKTQAELDDLKRNPVGESSSDNAQLQKSLDDSKEELSKLNEILGGKSMKYLESFLREKGFYDNPKGDKTTPNETEEIYTNRFYFSSCYKDGDVGVFEDENKTLARQPETLYTFELAKNKPMEAIFYFDASASMEVSILASAGFTVEPVCNSVNVYLDSHNRVKYVSKGKAYLDNEGRWIVKEEDKAKIRYE
jgi:hypothetical protein